jgi:hypothetical protein
MSALSSVIFSLARQAPLSGKRLLKRFAQEL